MNTPKTDNECTMMGWTEYFIELGGYELHISVAPDTDLDSAFIAFDHDEQEILRVKGWLIGSIEVL